MNDVKEKIKWSIQVPIFRNTVILKQLGLAIGIPFGVVILFLAFASGKNTDTLYALGLVGTVLFLTFLFVLLVYGGKYDAEFVLDNAGVLCRTQANQAKKNRIVNTLTVLLGLFSRNSTAAGAGMLAQSRQEVFLEWKQITKVSYLPRSRTIMLRGGWLESIALFCTEENYAQIEQEVMLQTKNLKQGAL